MQFSTFVKNKREAKGWSQSKLAAKLGIHCAYLSRVENGITVPRITNAIRISKALGVDVGELARVTDTYTLHGQAKANHERRIRKQN